MQNARTTAVMLEHNQHSGIATTLKLPRAVGGSCGTRSHPRARRWSTELARTMSLENGLSVAAPGASLRAGARSVSVGSIQVHWKSFQSVSQSVVSRSRPALTPKFSFRHRGHRTGVHTDANFTTPLEGPCPLDRWTPLDPLTIAVLDQPPGRAFVFQQGPQIILARITYLKYLGTIRGSS